MGGNCVAEQIKISNVVTPKGASILFGTGDVTISGSSVTPETPKYEAYDIIITDESDLPIPARQIIHENQKQTVESYLTELDTDKMEKVNPEGNGSFSLNRKSETTIGQYSFSEGYMTTSSNIATHAEGYNTIAAGSYQHTQGKFNIPDNLSHYAHIVGNGTDESQQSNAHTIDWEGNAWFAGDVYVGSNSGIEKDEGSVKLVKETDTIPIIHGGTGATTAAEALQNFGLSATANEINNTAGTTSNIQTQLDNKMTLVPVTVSDVGKFLRVNDSGVWAAETILNVEDVSF